MATLPSFKTFLQKSQGGVPDISNDAVKIGGKLGSNEGGEYLVNGVHHYVKTYRNPQQAATEVAAAHVYDKLGVPTLNPHIVRMGDNYGVASKWRSDLRPLGVGSSYNAHTAVLPHGYGAMSEDQKNQMARHFVAAVVTKNWDAIGLAHDNVMGTEGGKLVNVDLGGAMRFRAQGEAKPFGDDIDEYKSLRIPGRPSGDAFNAINDTHIHKAIGQLKNLNRDDLVHHFKSVGLAEPEAHADSIMGRAAKLQRMIPE